MKEQIIQRGAEAVLIKKGDLVLKRRVVKGYRLKDLDEKLRKTRTRKESKLLEKAAKIIDVPRMIKTNDKEMEIDMEFIDGKKLSETLDDLKDWKDVCEKIGKNIARIHDAGIIHGDLTTSNMIYFNEKVYFIDFGLGYESDKVEDKAVDLHLIKQALEAKHFGNWENMFKEILEGYKISRNFDKTIKQFEKVEKRGRYKEQY